MSQCQKITQGNPSAFQKISGIENFMDTRRGGISRFFTEISNFSNLLFHRTKKLCRGTLLCFGKFLVWKNFIEKRGRDGVSRFSVETFLPHSTGEFRRRFLLCFRNFLVSKNLIHARGTSRLFVENFLSHSTKNFLGEPLSVSLNSGIEFFLRKGGISRFFSKNFCFTEPKHL